MLHPEPVLTLRLDALSELILLVRAPLPRDLRSLVPQGRESARLPRVSDTLLTREVRALSALSVLQLSDPEPDECLTGLRSESVLLARRALQPKGFRGVRLVGL